MSSRYPCIAPRPPATLAFLAALFLAASGFTAHPVAAQEPPASLHDLKATDLEGNPVDLASYRGKVVLAEKALGAK